MIARKRAALRARQQRARDRRRPCYDENWRPYRPWSAKRILRTSHRFLMAGRGTRNYRTARSRAQYGCRTGGAW